MACQADLTHAIQHSAKTTSLCHGRNVDKNDIVMVFKVPYSFDISNDNDNEWQWQWMTMTMNDNDNDNEWQWQWQWMTMTMKIFYLTIIYKLK